MAALWAQRHTATAGWCDPPPPSDGHEAVGVAAERDRLKRLGLPPAVVLMVCSSALVKLRARPIVGID